MTRDVLRLAVFGQPVTHSLSPRIHGLFAEEAGLTIDYRAVEASPGTLTSALTAFRQEGGAGCNVTLPLKAEAAELASQHSERVRRAGAANTLRWMESGWAAENTDGLGLVADLQRVGLAPQGKRIALLGAGGAAAGVLAALLAAGPASVDIFNRTEASARALAESHEDLGPVSAAPLTALAQARGFDLVLNATSHGHQGQLPPLHEGLFADGALYDLNYGPAAAPLLAWCQARQIPARDGLGMLVGQAAESFRIWTGFRPGIEPVIQHLRQGD